MALLAIDPGTVASGFVVLDGTRIINAGVVGNAVMLQRVRESSDEIVIEMVASMGMAVGREVFETVLWIGRFIEASNGNAHRLFRKDIKLHLCGTPRAKDANIWQVIVDRFGGKETAIGRKKTPGPLYGVSSHARAALAVGLCWLDGVRSEGL